MVIFLRNLEFDCRKFDCDTLQVPFLGIVTFVVLYWYIFDVVLVQDEMSGSGNGCRNILHVLAEIINIRIRGSVKGGISEVLE